MLEMAIHFDEGPIHLAEIARRQEISVKYLEQIIIPLKKAGYVKSVRGPKGGHMLAKPPHAIHMDEIVSLLEGGIGITECSENSNGCERSSLCHMRFLWKEITEAIHERLHNITLLDLVRMNSEES
jgi:Rrf2 family protein